MDHLFVISLLLLIAATNHNVGCIFYLKLASGCGIATMWRVLSLYHVYGVIQDLWEITSNPSCAVGTQVNYDILLFHDSKGDEYLQFYVGIFSRPTLKLLLSSRDLWIPCWNWYAIWPSLLICDWEHAFDYSAVTWASWCQRTLLFFNSLLRLAKIASVRITGIAPVTGNLQGPVSI